MTHKKALVITLQAETVPFVRVLMLMIHPQTATTSSLFNSAAAQRAGRREEILLALELG